jgi:hypothetical protein
MRRASAALAALIITACNSGEPPAPKLQAIRLPTGATLAPDGAWLFVANSNLDLQEQNSTLVALSLESLYIGLATPRPAGAALDASAPCRWSEPDAEAEAIVECDPALLIARERSVQIPSGAGNVELDLPAGAEGPWRLLVPSALENLISWVDVRSERAGIIMDCGQDAAGQCATQYQIPIPLDDASRLTIDPLGARVAYLPHLLGGAFTLIDLDGGFGPEVAAVRENVFDRSTNMEFFGGFVATVRPCDPAAAPRVTLGCTRPLVYVTQRFWPGIRTLSVNPGLKQIVAFEPGLGATQFQEIDDAFAKLVGDRPQTGELAFEDPAGERLLVVHTTPPELSRVDTSLGPDGDPRDVEIATISLCRNPNLLALYRPPGAESLALVSCYSDSQVAVVALGTFTTVATLDVEAGPNELVVDLARRKLYVVQTLASTIGVVELDAKSPDYLHIIGRVGLASDE